MTLVARTGAGTRERTLSTNSLGRNEAVAAAAVELVVVALLLVVVVTGLPHKGTGHTLGGVVVKHCLQNVCAHGKSNGCCFSSSNDPGKNTKIHACKKK